MRLSEVELEQGKDDKREKKPGQVVEAILSNSLKSRAYSRRSISISRGRGKHIPLAGTVSGYCNSICTSQKATVDKRVSFGDQKNQLNKRLIG